MKKTNAFLLILLALVLAGAGGWWRHYTPGDAPINAVDATPWLPTAMAQGTEESALRARLVTGLDLDIPQQKKLDEITANMRPRLAALRELPEAQAAPARAKLGAERQQRINAMLNPDQRAAYELMQAKAEVARKAQ